MIYSDSFYINPKTSKISGIYIIKNISNGKRYIGSSSVSIYRRIKCHFRKLRKGTHSNKRLLHDFYKYGESSFRVYYFSLNPEEVLNKEYVLMNKYSFSYNLCRIKSKIAYHKGLKRSSETCKKISLALTGRKQSTEHSLAVSKGRSKYTILQYDLNNNFINEHHEGVYGVARKLNIPRRSIQECLTGNNKTGYGYVWVYSKNFRA